MSDWQMTLFLISAEAALVFGLALLVMGFLGFRRRKQDREALARLVASTAEDDGERRAALEQVLGKKGLAEPGNQAREVEQQEKAVIRDFVQAYFQREQATVEALGDRLRELSDHALSLDAPAGEVKQTGEEAGETRTGGEDPALVEEVEELRKNNAELNEQLTESLATVSTLVEQYGQSQGQEVSPKAQEILDTLMYLRGKRQETPDEANDASETDQDVLIEMAGDSEAPADSEAAAEPEADAQQPVEEAEAVEEAAPEAATEPEPAQAPEEEVAEAPEPEPAPEAEPEATVEPEAEPADEPAPVDAAEPESETEATEEADEVEESAPAQDDPERDAADAEEAGSADETEADVDELLAETQQEESADQAGLEADIDRLVNETEDEPDANLREDFDFDELLAESDEEGGSREEEYDLSVPDETDDSGEGKDYEADMEALLEESQQLKKDQPKADFSEDDLDLSDDAAKG